MINGISITVLVDGNRVKTPDFETAPASGSTFEYVSNTKATKRARVTHSTIDQKDDGTRRITLRCSEV